MLLERVLPWLGSFRDQVVVVTGASSGIGRETALTFARLGARVALVARRRRLLESLCKEIRAAGGEALVVPADVGNQASVRAAVTHVRRACKRVDILVNCAGVLMPASVAKIKEEDLEKMLRVNLFGVLFMSQAVIPSMQRRGSGTIINVASLAGRRGVTPLGGYCATKFAVVGLTEALRTELSDSQLHVGLVLPGVTDTPMAAGPGRAALFPAWPASFHMPPEWVAAAIVLACRFGLREISVPPGTATLEVIGSLAPAASDALIGWITAAGRLATRGAGS